MAEYSLTIPTTVTAGGAIPFNNTIVSGCCNVRHRSGSGLIKLKGGSCCKPSVYHVQFHAVVTDTPGTIQLGLYLDGELLPETLMSVVAAADTNVLSVDASTEVVVDGCCASLSARVVLGTDVTINTADIIVRKEAA